MYSALIYPVADPVVGYSRPPLPETFVKLSMSSPTWNPFSLKEEDRIEYWEDTAGTIPVTQFPLSLAVRAEAKTARQTAVESILVTTSHGNTFNGDEESQTRMARAIIALNFQPQVPVPSIVWVLSNNATVVTTADELTEALSLAGAAQAALWII